MKEELYPSLKEQYAVSSWAKDPLRAQAWDCFTKKGLPSKQLESYRYVPLPHLFRQSYQIPTGPDLSQLELPAYEALLVFVNGFFIPTLSKVPQEIIAIPLSEAISTYSGFVKGRWVKSLQEEQDAFALLNLAVHGEGCFVYVPPRTVLKTPIYVLHIVSSPVSLLSSPRLHCVLGSQAQASLWTSYQAPAGLQQWVNEVLEVSLEEGAQLEIKTLLEVPKDTFVFSAMRGVLKQDARLCTVSKTSGSATVRQDYRIQLKGENGEAILKGILPIKGKNHAHVNVLMEHLAPHCRSRQLFKGVLWDTARSSFEGKIFVDSIAQKTEAFQSSKHLLLSDHAIVDTKPNLEIFADDVKASHGATIGQLDEEQLFYLQSRGLLKEQARDLLVKGFIQDVLDEFPKEFLSGEVLCGCA